MDLFPIYRIEQFLDAIVSSTTPPEPIERVEYFLAKIAGASVELPAPISRVDHFLAKICGQNVTLPIPQSREERYLAKIAGEDVEIPPFPVNRIDYWLAEWASGPAAKTLTVTGVSPLLLVNAIAHNLLSLTQTGKCSQASTPTPESPVDIVCNNGALQMVDDELPSGYKRVLGFACNNNAMWQITDFKLRGSDTVRVSFSVTAACNVFGCYQGTDANDNYDLYVSTTSGSKYLRYGNGTYLSYWSNANLGERFDVVFSPTGTSGMPQDSTWTAKTFTAENDMLIGSTTTGGTSSKLKGNLYGNIEVDGRLKLIPCERLSDNVLGYYDTYGASFYEPYEGFDGAVSLGYDGSHYSLQAVGTPEEIRVLENLYDESGNTDGYYIDGNGAPASGASSSYSAAIPVENGKTYVWSGVSGRTGSHNKRIYGYKDEGTGSASRVTAISTKSVSGIGVPYELEFTINNTSIKYVRLSFDTADTDVLFYESQNPTATAENLFAVGDAADTQEIVSGAVTRKAGVKVLNGTEQVGSSSAYGQAYYIASAANAWGAAKAIVACTHFEGKATAGSSQPDGTCFFNVSGHFYFRTDTFNSVTDFKNWLKDQYAAGTPVIVLFQRAAAATESVAAQPIELVAGNNAIVVSAEVEDIQLVAEYKGIEQPSRASAKRLLSIMLNEPVDDMSDEDAEKVLDIISGGETR